MYPLPYSGKFLRGMNRQSLPFFILLCQNTFSIFEGIPGSIVSFVIHNSSGIVRIVPADCIDGVCEKMDKIDASNVCSSSGDGAISVSAMNRLGQGPASQLITVGQYLLMSVCLCTCIRVYVSM